MNNAAPTVKTAHIRKYDAVTTYVALHTSNSMSDNYSPGTFTAGRCQQRVTPRAPAPGNILIWPARMPLS